MSTKITLKACTECTNAPGSYDWTIDWVNKKLKPANVSISYGIKHSTFSAMFRPIIQDTVGIAEYEKIIENGKKLTREQEIKYKDLKQKREINKFYEDFLGNPGVKGFIKSQDVKVNMSSKTFSFKIGKKEINIYNKPEGKIIDTIVKDNDNGKTKFPFDDHHQEGDDDEDEEKQYIIVTHGKKNNYFEEIIDSAVNAIYENKADCLLTKDLTKAKIRELFDNPIKPPMRDKKIVPVDKDNRPVFFAKARYYKNPETGEESFTTKLNVPTKNGLPHTLTKEQLIGNKDYKNPPDGKTSLYGPTLYASTEIVANKIFLKKGSFKIMWKLANGVVRKIVDKTDRLAEEQSEEMEEIVTNKEEFDELENNLDALINNNFVEKEIKENKESKENIKKLEKDNVEGNLDSFLQGVEDEVEDEKEKIENDDISDKED